MQKTDLRVKLSKKNTIIILASILVVVLVGMIAIAAGHITYLDKQKAQITNTADFSVISPQMFVYVYEDGTKTVDFDEIIKVNNKATFTLTKIIDEDLTVSKPTSNKVIVTTNPTRVVVVQVQSPSKNKTLDYRITVVSKSLSGNTINAQLGDAYLNGGFINNYSGQNDIILPSPIKNYISPDGDEHEYQFLGWYTTPDYLAGSEITEIKAGSIGQINLYPQFAPPAPYRDAKDGFAYFAYGKYPQSKVTDYNLLAAIKASAPYSALGNANGKFTYDTVEYFKFKPDNVPNLSDNGYSSSSYYVFRVEPIWWRVLAGKNTQVNNGTIYPIIAKNVLNCSPFSKAEEGWAEKQYNKYAKQLNGDLTTFLKKYFDPDTIYGESDLRNSILGIYSGWIAPNENTTYVKPRAFTKYKNAISSNTETYTDAVWALSYSEAFNASYGFDPDWQETDRSRQSVATDFALANGVYSSTTKAYVGKGSWWLRGSGTTFDYTYKKIAYVKYTGKLHSYAAKSFSLSSGVRPSMNFQLSFTVA